MAAAILNLGKPAVTNEIRVYIKDANDAITVINTTKIPDGTLISDYSALIKEMEDAIAAEATTELTAYTARLADFKGKYDALNERKIRFLVQANPTIYTYADLVKLTYGTAVDIALFVILLIAVLLGGTIASHYFIDESLAYRLYYFVYGAAFFPFVHLYALFNPPYWRATLFPWVERGKESSFLSKFPVSVLWNFISYSRPSPLDVETLGYTKGLLSIFIGGLLVSIGALYYISFRRLPI